MDKPVIRCLVSYPVGDLIFTSPALVSLDTAADLKEKGYMVAVDPADERDLATWERNHPWYQRMLGT